MGDGGKGGGQHAGPRQYLEEGNAHKDPGHDDQVVLQPLLKLAHTAFGVDGALLLQLLGQGTQALRSAHPPPQTSSQSFLPRAWPLSRPLHGWLLLTGVSAQTSTPPRDIL